MSMWKVFRSELLKMRKSSIWLLILISPVLSSLVGFGELNGSGEHTWITTLAIMSWLHGMLFLPLMTGVFSAFVCRFEHIEGGWKQLLAMPVSRTSVFLAKFLVVVLLLALSQALFLAGLLLVGNVKDLAGPVPWNEILTSITGGWLACMPLAALQMGVSTAWSSFAAPLAVNVIFTLPNILVSNSEKYGPFYPWAQPVLMMMPRLGDNFGAFNVSFETLIFVVFGSFLIFFLSGFAYFQRKEV
ncbi:ABC transporter permease [Bacillus sp. T33-2]|uniref:ABC transporter permease n=1 Tax=Bacillus sp. T33-2 TaxID=2054168 RepID=UPI000C765F44|nr:ABC transporter permease [Bacillus sp. T33-2]PLR96563.1 hypothetical protein CVD19_11265 [Bacillus sp. T33-2]